MKKSLLSLVFLFSISAVTAQQKDIAYYTTQLDSLAQTNNTAAVFSAMYIGGLQNVEGDILKEDTGTGAFIRKFETAFIDSFLVAARAWSVDHKGPPQWKTYFDNPGLQPVQLQMLGINAHINGEMWKVFTGNFSREEMKRYGPAYINYQKALERYYDNLFTETVEADTRLHLLHQLSFGLDKWAGKRLLQKWRVRQVKLALLYYDDPAQFKKKLVQVERKKERTDRFIIKFMG